MQRLFPALHAFLYRLSGGFLGGRYGKAPILLLTTTGRRSGRARTKPLMYVADGESLAVAASNAGSDRHPMWWLNLKGDRRARVRVRRRTLSVVAREAGPEEKARLWPRFVAMFPAYEGYARRSKRDIPVVILRESAEDKA